MIKIGAKIPDFHLYDDGGNLVHLYDYQAKYLILYFYPKDMTGGCTKEACNYKDVYLDLKAKDAIIIGISKDDIKSHQKFKTKYELPFILLSDENLEMIKYFDLWQEKKLYGRTYMGTLRKTFILNSDFEVIYIKDKVSVTTDGKDSLDFINECEG